MGKEMKFATEVVFKGTPDEFQEMTQALVKLPVRVRVPWPFPYPGGWPVPLDQLLSKKVLDGLVEDRQKIKIIEGIRGGIRDPHLHVKNQVVLLDRPAFKQMVGLVAQKLAEQIAEGGTYMQTVGAIQDMVEMQDLMMP